MKNEPSSDPSKSSESTMAIMLSIADTTWRMVVPPAVLVPAGLYGDIHLGTKPFLTLAATAIGLGLGVILIRRQLKEFK